MKEAIEPPDLNEVFNLDEIRKGDIFRYDTLSKLIGETPGTSAWALRVTQVADALQKRLWAMEKPYTLRFHKGNLKVCTDAEAVRFNRGHFLSGRKRMIKAHRQATEVDTSNLDEETRKSHEQDLRHQGFELAAVTSARKQIRAAASKRERPLLPSTA